MKIEVKINSEVFWVKLVDFLQQNWALIEQKEGKCSVWFINDAGGLFDKLEFAAEEEAESGLERNGFQKYLDRDEKFRQFVHPPRRTFTETPRRIYSSGEFWK